MSKSYFEKQIRKKDFEELEEIKKNLEKERREIHGQLVSNNLRLEAVHKLINKSEEDRCIKNNGNHILYNEEDFNKTIWIYCEVCPYRRVKRDQGTYFQ